VYIGSLIAFID